ncbi:MAG: hypothetical protein JSS38_01920 [Nitrospira sp.]|nr:hypothetical protein [Nitrospira sp.]
MNQGKRDEVFQKQKKDLFKYLYDSNSNQLPFLSFLTSRVQKRISIALGICFILLISSVSHSVLEENLHPLVVAILLLAIGIAVSLLSHSASICEVHERRVTAAQKEPDNSNLPSEQIILYLRSFIDDENAAKLPSIIADSETSSEYIPWAHTEEEQMKAVMDEFGYLYTIQKPDDTFPHAGASRLQVGSEWQTKVRELMAKSLFVVIRLGATDGLLWELQTAVRYLDPCRLLLLVPFDEIEYNNFCGQHQDVFPKSLPRYDEGVETVGTLRGIICFQEDWTPEFLILETSGLYLPKDSLQSALKVALLPFFDRLKLPYQPLHASFGELFERFLWGSIACVLLSVPILASPALSLWFTIPMSAIGLIILGIIYVEMREHYCLKKRFPGRY